MADVCSAVSGAALFLGFLPAVIAKCVTLMSLRGSTGGDVAVLSAHIAAFGLVVGFVIEPAPLEFRNFTGVVLMAFRASDMGMCTSQGFCGDRR